ATVGAGVASLRDTRGRAKRGGAADGAVAVAGGTTATGAGGDGGAARSASTNQSAGPRTSSATSPARSARDVRSRVASPPAASWTPTPRGPCNRGAQARGLARVRRRGQRATTRLQTTAVADSPP